MLITVADEDEKSDEDEEDNEDDVGGKYGGGINDSELMDTSAAIDELEDKDGDDDVDDGDGDDEVDEDDEEVEKEDIDSDDRDLRLLLGSNNGGGGLDGTNHNHHQFGDPSTRKNCLKWINVDDEERLICLALDEDNDADADFSAWYSIVVLSVTTKYNCQIKKRNIGIAIDPAISEAMFEIT